MKSAVVSRRAAGANRRREHRARTVPRRQSRPKVLTPRTARSGKSKPLPVVIPQQFAPPQEEYASFPDSASAAAAAAAPSACQIRLAKIAVFQPLPVLVGPGDCGATDAVLIDAIILPDQSKVAVTPPATMRCPMAEAIAHWVRDDVAPSLKDLPPLRGLDNFDSYSCRGRNNIRAAQLSEHGKADALDVRDFKLADGRELGLTDINVDKDWRDAIKSSACARFSTVLGPGSDGFTRSTSISILPSAITTTKSANGTCACRRRREAQAQNDDAGIRRCRGGGRCAAGGRANSFGRSAAAASAADCRRTAIDHRDNPTTTEMACSSCL